MTKIYKCSKCGFGKQLTTSNSGDICGGEQCPNCSAKDPKEITTWKCQEEKEIPRASGIPEPYRSQMASIFS